MRDDGRDVSRAQPTSAPRAAVLDDVPAIIALVAEMYSEMAEEYSGQRSIIPGDWKSSAETEFRERLGADVGAFVIEGESGEIVAVAVGRLHRTLPSPRRTGTTAGYVEWVVTDAAARRQGNATAVISALLAWFESSGTSVVDLNASSSAETIYRRLGFDSEGPVALSRRLRTLDR
ncbi:GNAT family N-acetyltransferase [Microbacterium sp. P05]|uniref:GNAT family N-acetyltransferase n=1 Tax=Microbacterium sp. P05 TaxID=3366948 RepID=UPI003744F104